MQGVGRRVPQQSFHHASVTAGKSTFFPLSLDYFHLKHSACAKQSLLLEYTVKILKLCGYAQHHPPLPEFQPQFGAFPCVGRAQGSQSHGLARPHHSFPKTPMHVIPKTWLSLSGSAQEREEAPRLREHGPDRRAEERARSRGARGACEAWRGLPGGATAGPGRQPRAGERGGSSANRLGRGYSLSQDSRLSPSASAILQPPGPAQRPQTLREPERDGPGRGLHRRRPSAAV